MSTASSYLNQAPARTEPRAVPNTSPSLDQQPAAASSLSSELSESSRTVVIAERWHVLWKIGEGSFGEVFLAEDVKTGAQYAIKRESKKMRHPQLEREYEFYELLAGGAGIPRCHWYGEHKDFNCLVLDLLGPSLKELRQSVKCFSLEDIVDLGCQMVDIMEHVHNRGLVFRDMKPDNFLFDSSCRLLDSEMVRMDGDMPHFTYKYPTCREVFDQWGEAKLHIVDFGLATWWRDKETGEPIPEGKRKHRNKIGTARYASVNVHNGRMHARRDDLEGLAYIILDLLLGSLPWSGIQARNSKAGWDRMRTMKRDTFMSDLCAGHPVGIVNFVEYTKRLRFQEDPDYAYMKRLLSGSLPGGKYSEPTRSPFGGDTVRQDVVNPDMYSERNEKQEKEKEELEQKFQQIQEETTTTTQEVQEVDSSGSSFKEVLAKMKLQEGRVGWYTYKRDEAPWEPDIDWDTKKPEDQNVTTRSWGEDQPNISWGQATDHEQDTWGSTWDSKDAEGWGSSNQPNWTSINATSQTAAGDQWRKAGIEGWGSTTHADDQWKQVSGGGGGGGGANASWRRVDKSKFMSDTWPPPKGRSNRPSGDRSQQQRKQTSVPNDRRRKKPEAHRDSSGTTSNAWDSQDYGGVWVANQDGDGWTVKDSSKGHHNQTSRGADKAAGSGHDTIPSRRDYPRRSR